MPKRGHSALLKVKMAIETFKGEMTIDEIASEFVVTVSGSPLQK